MDFIVNTVHEFNFFFFFFYLRPSHESTGWGYNPSFPTFSHQKPNLASLELSDNLLFDDFGRIILSCQPSFFTARLVHFFKVLQKVRRSLPLNTNWAKLVK